MRFGLGGESTGDLFDLPTFLTETGRTANVLCTTSTSIDHISSVLSQQGNIGQINYAASKGGILANTKALAKDGFTHRVSMPHYPA